MNVRKFAVIAVTAKIALKLFVSVEIIAPNVPTTSVILAKSAVIV